MTTLYKLTTQDFKTRKGRSNECTWGENVSHSGTGKGDLCGPGYIHAYTHPLLAALFGPVHVNVDDPVLWECEGDVALSDHGLKVGCATLTTLRRVPLPVVTLAQRIMFAVLCARESHQEWVERQLRGGATVDAAYAAYAAYAAAYVARTRAEPLDLTALAAKAMEVT